MGGCVQTQTKSIIANDRSKDRRFRLDILSSEINMIAVTIYLDEEKNYTRNFEVVCAHLIRD